MQGPPPPPTEPSILSLIPGFSSRVPGMQTWPFGVFTINFSDSLVLLLFCFFFFPLNFGHCQVSPFSGAEDPEPPTLPCRHQFQLLSDEVKMQGPPQLPPLVACEVRTGGAKVNIGPKQKKSCKLRLTQSFEEAGVWGKCHPPHPKAFVMSRHVRVVM